MEQDQVMKYVQLIYADLSASFYALANALEKSGALTKSALAEAAQERLVKMTSTQPPEATAPLALLRAIATQFEGLPNELPPDQAQRR